MGDVEDFTFDPAPEEKAITGFFVTPIADALKVHGPEDVDKLAETPLAWTEVCEPMLKELYSVTKARKEFAKNEKQLKDELKPLVGKERGMIQRGQFGVKVAEVSREVTEWRRVIAMIKLWAKDQIGPDAKKEIDHIVSECTMKFDGELRITPYVVGSEPADDD